MDYGPSYNDAAVWPSLSSTLRPTAHTVDKYEMIWWAQLAWITAFSFMLIVAIGGNVIVIWIVTAHRRMRNVTNYFLVNLSIADLLMSFLNCLFNFIYMVRRDWQFGETYCKISNFIATVTVAASVFTLTGISCDRYFCTINLICLFTVSVLMTVSCFYWLLRLTKRYLAIVHPLQPHLSKRKAVTSIMLIWLFSAMLGTPCLIYSAIIAYTTTERIRTSCILIWPDGLPTDSKYDYMYQVIIIVTTYFIPMCLMICCYFAMGRVLWGSKSIGEMTQRQMESIKSKRKIVRMFIMVVIIFGVCWLPYHSYFIYTHYDRTILYSMYIQHVYLGFYWLAMANAMVNPLIYYWMNMRFRKYFNMCLCGWTKYITKSPIIRSVTIDNHSTPLSHRTNSSSNKGKRDKDKRNGHMHYKLTHNCKTLQRSLISRNSSSLLKRAPTEDAIFLKYNSSIIIKHSNSV